MGPKQDNVKQAILEKWKEKENKKDTSCLNIPQNKCDFPCAWDDNKKSCNKPPASYRIK